MTIYKPDEQLISILSQTMDDDSAAFKFIKNKYSKYLSKVKARDLAFAEQELVNRGIEFGVIEKKLPQHIRLLNSHAKMIFKSLPDTHILRKLIAEHHLVKDLLVQIRQMSSHLGHVLYFTATSGEFKSLIKMAEHVSTSSKHTDIEQDIIFPLLERSGIEAIPRLLRAEQFELRHYSAQFHELASKCCMKNIGQTRERFREISKRLPPLKQRYMLVEENVIYPVALETANNKTWDTLQKKCEKAGFLDN